MTPTNDLVELEQRAVGALRDLRDALDRKRSAVADAIAGLAGDVGRAEALAKVPDDPPPPAAPAGPTRRPGRPPKSEAASVSKAPPAAGKPKRNISAEARERIRAGARKRWGLPPEDTASSDGQAKAEEPAAAEGGREPPGPDDAEPKPRRFMTAEDFAAALEQRVVPGKGPLPSPKKSIAAMKREAKRREQAQLLEAARRREEAQHAGGGNGEVAGDGQASPPQRYETRPRARSGEHAPINPMRQAAVDTSPTLASVLDGPWKVQRGKNGQEVDSEFGADKPLTQRHVTRRRGRPRSVA